MGRRPVRLAMAAAVIVGSAVGGIVVGGSPATAEPAPCERVGVIGDSLAVGPLTMLPQELVEFGILDVRTDAKVGRRVANKMRTVESGVTALQRMRAAGYEPDCFVISLGTNDLGIWKGELKFRTVIEALLNEIGDGPRVLWINTYWKSFTATSAVFNGVLADIGAARPGFHVFDWSSIATTHPKYLTRDGVHQSLLGRREWARLVARAVLDDLAGGLPGEPPDPGCTVSTVPLKVGKRGPDSLCVEMRLHQLLYLRSTPNDRFWFDTKTALQRWQSLHGIKATGVLDASTRQVLGLDPVT